VNRFFIVRPFARPDSKPKRYSNAGGRRSKATFFKWRSKYGGATVSDVKRLREPRGGNHEAETDARPRNQHYLHEVVIAWSGDTSPVRTSRRRPCVTSTPAEVAAIVSWLSGVGALKVILSNDARGRDGPNRQAAVRRWAPKNQGLADSVAARSYTADVGATSPLDPFTLCI
jgi:hypothetical protein